MTTIQLPDLLYTRLETMAQEKQSDPASIIQSLLEAVDQQAQWRQEWRLLRDQIQREGGYPIDETIDELVERMRKIRTEIFEQDYAHLYR